MLDVDVYALQRLTRAAGAAASIVNRALYAESLPRTDRDLAGRLTFQLFRPGSHHETH